MAGKLIVIEGIDGSGKSTQFKLLCDRLTADGIEHRRITFPRYDQPSSALIKMYLGGEFGDDPNAVNAYAASSFFAVDRYASYMQDWREHYESGGLVLTDRYTTSNALHQGAKMAEAERKEFFEWLYEYEFKLIGLPKPSLVLYMSIDADVAAGRLKTRQATTGTHADIHEQDLLYLKDCAQSGNQAAAQYSWHAIECMKDGKPRTETDISDEVYMRVKCLTSAKK